MSLQFLGSSSGSGGSAAPTIVAGGNLGASRSQTVAAGGETWLTGTLNANHTLTLTLGAGARLRLFGVQDATGGRTLTISDGVTSQTVTIASAAGAAFQVAFYSDGTTLYIDLAGAAPGAASGPVTSMVSTFDPRLVATTSISIANTLRGGRIRIPYTGNLRDLYVYVGTTLNTASVIGAVYDTGQAAPTVRTRLWQGASTLLGASGNYWQSLGDPNLAVAAGQQIDVSFITDSSTPSFARYALPVSGIAILPSQFLPSGVPTKLAWSSNIGSFTTPTTMTDGGVPGADVSVPLIIGRIS